MTKKTTEAQLFTCRLCGEDKPKEKMRRNRSRKNGIDGECKACRNARESANGTFFLNRLRQYEIRSGGKRMYATSEEMQSLARTSNCTYCNISLTHGTGDKTELTFDHVYPIEESTFDGYGATNVSFNFAAVCRGCNSAKGSRHIYEFYQRSEKFTPILWTKFVEEFGRRLFNRELTAIEIEQLKRSFEEESVELQALRQSEKGATG